MDKINDKKSTGFFLVALAILIIYNCWNRFSTLPPEFLLGAFSGWLLKAGSQSFREAEKIENERE